MDPIVTLRVGSNETELRTHEGTLCCLQFFRAALHGGFQEASRVIMMPEDEKEIIGALIEFLTTGRYTYAFGISDNDDSCDLTQAFFHVAMYHTAIKYDCGPLVHSALLSVSYMMTRLNGGDLIALVGETYSRGLPLSKFKGFPHVIALLPKILRDAYDRSPIAMEHMWLQNPEFCYDLIFLYVFKNRDGQL